MKIAIDVSPLQTGHRIRGVGSYVNLLTENLTKIDKTNQYVFVKDNKFPKDANVIHYPYFEPFFKSLPLFSKIPFVVTIHDLIPFVFPDNFPSGPKGKLRWTIQKHSLKKASAIITDSNASKKDIIKYVGVSEDKISVVYLAAGEQFKKLEIGNWKLEIKKRYGLPNRFLLYVGDVTWNKNLVRLVQGIKQTEITLVMVGKALAQEDFDRKNPWNKDLVKVQSLIKGDKRFIRLGFITNDDLINLYNAATVFVMPSLYEGFGLPVLEAMACGCPVVTTREGSLAEIADDAAYFVNAYDVNSIAEGIKAVFINEKLQEELRSKGFENVKKYSWQKTAEKTLEVYKQAVS